MHKYFKLATLTLCLTPLMAPVCQADEDDIQGDTLYTLSNASQNAVYALHIDNWGNTTSVKHFATGGKGTTTGLGNQGALALSHDHRFLFAVNAGSNEVSVFKINENGLVLLDHVKESGVTPISITVSHDKVYVVNSGDNSIFGYQFDRSKGKLHPLAKSYLSLGSMGAGAAQISFNKDGDTLVVTEKANSKITSILLDDDGIPATTYTINSAGNTPFGFAFGHHDSFFVSEAEGGAANAATVSAYKLQENGEIKLLDKAVAVGKTAACWLATTPNGRMAFTADTPASSLSSFAIDHAGNLTLLMSQAVIANTPTDLVVSHDGNILYSLNNGDHSIGVYGIEWNGGLKSISSISGIPAGATGLVLR
ncbi:beta-propeller fold lactonase family protein [Methylomonas sp. AM2-LC]|uniref:lactonase family protein n=1 Tax=Methylomonas sp. AM2-LC TaxID=3153301 RepID=UPI0032640703